jgi:uncharacterized repeat protein (TIGR01451 family)
MRISHANSRRDAPRLAAIAMAVVGVVALMLVFASRAGATADLGLTKSDAPDPVEAGSNLTYTIQVSNAGPDEATNVTVVDTLPGGQTDFVTHTPSQGTCTRAADIVTCNLGTLTSGGGATVSIVVRPRKSGTISNTAVVSGTAPGGDANAANNSEAEATTVVSKGQAKAPKQPGRASCAAPTISGTAGDDVITGSDRADVIVTFAGNDQVFALGGKDLVCTGTGFDLVHGGFGGDTVIGGSESDRLIGNAGGDLLKGKAGGDRLRGKSGNDVLNGGSNRDSCKGGKGADVLKRCP